MHVAIAPAPAQALIAMTAAPLVARFSLAPRAAPAVLPVGASEPEVIIAQAVAQTTTPLSKPVAHISLRNNREKKCEGRLGHSTLDRETLISIVATRHRLGEQYGV